jgi:serralysin
LFIGTDGNDFVTPVAVSPGVIVAPPGAIPSAADDGIAGLDGDDRITGWSGRDTITSGAGHVSLYGGDDDAAVDGGAGNDTLTGGTGKDGPAGGTGADHVVSTTTSDSGNAVAERDTITDFAPGSDKIDLSGVASGLVFSPAGAFSGVAGEVICTSGGLWRIDVDGDRTADFPVLLIGIPTLGAGDLIL